MEYIEDIRGSGQHLLNLINDLLDLAKIESGEHRLREELVSLEDVIEGCLRMTRERARDAGLSVRTEISDDLETLWVDQRVLKQIVINLLSNAIKFTPEGGSITIGGHLSADGEPVVTIADTGIGMAEKDIETALAPFGQIESGLSRNYEGTGLGLPLAQRLAEKHEGTLTIESTPGAGTTVTVTLPANRHQRDVFQSPGGFAQITRNGDIPL
jgi:signal transduction histidine kinase